VEVLFCHFSTRAYACVSTHACSSRVCHGVKQGALHCCGLLQSGHTCNMGSKKVEQQLPQESA
jgi:hypothetical protein